MADVFISYDHYDHAEAAGLAGEIEKSGLTVWWDPKVRGGSRYAKVILDELNAAHVVLVIWSRNSVHSEFVEDEARRALKAHKLVPLRTTDVEIEDIPLGFTTRLILPVQDIARIIEAINALGRRPARNTSPPCNMFTFCPEERSLTEGIQSTQVYDERERCVRPAICFGSSNTEQRFDIQTGMCAIPDSQRDVVWSCPVNPPYINDSGLFLAGWVPRVPWGKRLEPLTVYGPQSESGYIVRINSGAWGSDFAHRWRERELPMSKNGTPTVENHGSYYYLSERRNPLIAGHPCGKQVLERRSALWLLLPGEIIFTKGCTPGDYWSIICAKSGPTFVDAHAFAEDFDEWAENQNWERYGLNNP